MIKNFLIRSVFLITFFTAPINYAASAIPSNTPVTEWVQRVLMDSLTASFRDTPSDIKSVQKYYSMAAWEPMNDFFNKEIKIIDMYKLSLHPKPLNKPTLVKDASCPKKLCWRVNQSYKVPELQMTIYFSLLITRAHSGNYLIQSLNMKIQHD